MMISYSVLYTMFAVTFKRPQLHLNKNSFYVLHVVNVDLLTVSLIHYRTLCKIFHLFPGLTVRVCQIYKKNFFLNIFHENV